MADDRPPLRRVVSRRWRSATMTLDVDVCLAEGRRKLLRLRCEEFVEMLIDCGEGLSGIDDLQVEKGCQAGQRKDAVGLGVRVAIASDLSISDRLRDEYFDMFPSLT